MPEARGGWGCGLADSPDMEVIPLFPIPVYLSDEYPLTAAERSVLIEQEWKTNPGGGNKSSVNSHLLDLPALAGLRAFLQGQVDYFAHEIVRIRRDCRFHITQSWANFNEKGTMHHLHAHANSVISGNFFVDGDSSTPISFRRPPSHHLFANLSLPIDELNVLNATDYNLANKKNRVMLFPSTTPHFVQPHQTDTPRISLAFNTFVKGLVGSTAEATELRL